MRQIAIKSVSEMLMQSLRHEWKPPLPLRCNKKME